MYCSQTKSQPVSPLKVAKPASNRRGELSGTVLDLIATRATIHDIATLSDGVWELVLRSSIGELVSVARDFDGLYESMAL